MVTGPHIYGGFNISPYLALKVFEAVQELTAQNLDISLSHVDDDNCDVCKQMKAREAARDASEPGRAGREWAA